MAVKVWKAAESVIKIDQAADVTLSASTVLDTAFASGTAIQGVMKDITVTEPIGDVEKIDLLGSDTDGFQNAEIEEKPAGLVEIQGTAILPGDEVVESIIYGTGTSATTHTTYRAGKAVTEKLALLLNLDDGTDEVSYAGTNMRVTAKDVKVTGPDGHYEITFTFKCLPRDFYGPQFKD